MISSIQQQTFKLLLVLLPSLQEEVLQEIKWHKIGMKSLLLLPPKQPHLSFQQTPQLLIMLSGQICLLFYLITLYIKQAYNIPGAILPIPSMLYWRYHYMEEELISYHPGNRVKKSYNSYQNGWLQHLLSRDCSKSFHDHYTSNDAETFSQKLR